jgi:hypothetical protein
MQCVEDCDDPNPSNRVLFEQPVWQTLQMFLGEMLCLSKIPFFVPFRPSLPDGFFSSIRFSSHHFFIVIPQMEKLSPSIADR